MDNGRSFYFVIPALIRPSSMGKPYILINNFTLSIVCRIRITNNE